MNRGRNRTTYVNGAGAVALSGTTLNRQRAWDARCTCPRISRVVPFDAAIPLSVAQTGRT